MKPIPYFSGYQITTDGRVWSEPKRGKGGHKGKWLSSIMMGDGHYKVTLHSGGKPFYKLVHRLVLETYVGPCPEGMECRHLNGKPQDNRLENLQWGTLSENQQDAVRHGTHSGLRYGENGNNVKLTEQKVKLIYNLYHSGADSQQGLADVFGVSYTTINLIVNKNSWKYLWE